MVEKLVVEDIAARTIRQKDGGIIVNIITLLKESLNAIPDGADEHTAKKAVAEFMKSLIPEVSRTFKKNIPPLDFR